MGRAQEQKQVSPMNFDVFLLSEDDVNPIRVGGSKVFSVARAIFKEECRAAKNVAEETGIACNVYLNKEQETICSKRFTRWSQRRPA